MRKSKAAALAVLTALLAVGCSSNTSSAPEASRTSAAADRGGALPEGIAAIGSPVTVADGSWTLSLAPFEKTETTSSAQGVPAGWETLRTKAVFTNTGQEIALLPDTTVTVRYGDLGRPAVLFRDAGLSGLPDADADTKVKPGARFTADLGIAVPAQAAGQRATVTAEATEEGLAQAEAVFFEGTLPGTAQASSDPSPTAPPATGAVLPLGSWYDKRLRVSALALGGAENGRRAATLDLTVVNDRSEPKPGLDVTVRVLTGDGLALAATGRPVLDYADAPIAPHRTATQTIQLQLPATAVPGPVTVEAVERDGTRATFDGQAG
ncbi:hypothetical protein ACF09G_31540 [Streptomyces albogriseolus]|uniref:hypothetical protein n=1 Tax=Streptomyces albogriseolus TaxID=1887 RepID=UPI0019C1F598|nr:hypothetical protein [Streptomyces sp.]